MTREHWELAKQIYWDTLSRGGMIWKGVCSAAILLGFVASVAALILQVAGGVHVLVFLATMLTGLLVIPACLCLIRIARTAWNAGAVDEPDAALEALQAAPTPKRQKERIYTPDYAFFFQRGTVLDVRNTSYLYSEWAYGLSDGRGPKRRVYRVGAARITGDYQVLFQMSVHQLRPKMPEEIRAVLAELTQHYPALSVDDSGMKH
ncbi:MAG: hypothetical protein IJI27_06895 [Oscillospiraceae bacterium]|nr:hypothetical protein [Oscillospiraceae bacterium]